MEIFIVILVLVVIFLVSREFFCWYWKINDIKELLKSIDSKLSNSNIPLTSSPQITNSSLDKNSSNSDNVYYNNSDNNSDSSENEKTAEEIEREKKEQELKELRSRIKSYDDLMNDPKIKEEAETMRKFYGVAAYEHYLEKKAKELNLK